MNGQSSLRAWVPRPVVRLLKRLRGIGWSGDYVDWAAACRLATGYDDPAISERVAATVSRVLAGEGDHERDGVIIAERSPRWPVLASLLHIHAADQCLRVLDFGGSLASSWWQHRHWLAGLAQVDWLVVEQDAFVAQGRRLFAAHPVRFSATLPEPGTDAPTVIFISSSLQYLSEPWAMLERLLALGARHLVIDRTAFAARDRLTVQRVPSRIYPASYPAWFLDHGRLAALLAARSFACVAEWSCDDDPTIAGTWFGGGHWRLEPRP